MGTTQSGLEQLRKQFRDNNANYKRTLITVVFSQDYVVDNCLEFGNFNNIGHRPCLRSEKINFKKGEQFKSVNFDISSMGIQDDVNLIYSSVGMNYNGKNLRIPFSQVNIIDVKSVSQSEAKDFTQNLSVVEAPKNVVTEQTFLQKNKTNLLIVGALVLGYLAYKKFNK
jgi:hypothetical protein